ncbi:MAG: riboflavin synthase subunit alpha [Ignavibacteria bacterium RIFOXYB2_FULL_36_7]|nr:MAG: riboflavin synthase subunit alpha [Ignavibacteria bacterium RIFOXYB2_FULL_36_7]
MFTGLVEETGKLKKKVKTGEGFQFTISASKVFDDLEIGSSISVNGCCLTVVKKEENAFSVDTIEETLKKTNLGLLEVGSRVNLERPLKADARLGGHFVLGHVDTTGVVKEIKELSNSHFMKIAFPEKFKNYLIYVGSISIDGVSMTVAELEENWFGVGIIPFTWQETIFSDKKVGDKVNLEFDVLGKYVEKIMEGKQDNLPTE